MYYTAGQILLTYSSANPSDWSFHPLFDFLGLFIIATGTGGIKPCAMTFGGDQFEKHEAKMLSMFVAIFYFTINVGALALSCLGQDNCYPLAFGIPAILMIISTVIFASGSCWYKKRPVKSNVIFDVISLISRAVIGKFHDSSARAHWLEHSLYNHDCNTNLACLKLKRRSKTPAACARMIFINDVKSLLRVMIMFIPLPMYYALIDQQAGVMTIQALQMDGRLWGDVLWLPDQMALISVVLVLGLVPLFTFVIYPVVGKWVKLTPLRKMCVGGFIVVFAFLFAGVVQLEINVS
ncbi:unnamed protein product [Bursaphelenchus xylophilus]|uniref:(pine wood nematode) hypothetical protein n=1 Tax=Bursaphelenchus xylophilus TaxID=6326 RepID=A0A811KMM1_BURXY|nr:unnamed protein product [Bursaphelenchus xylophilus]CAG9100360.1 unnamed protein product [Bursaphelenchus xylophilus]